MISIAEDKKAIIKCDLCFRRQAEGLLPACVMACPVDALSFDDVDQGAKKARAKAAAQVVAASDTVTQK